MNLSNFGLKLSNATGHCLIGLLWGVPVALVGGGDIYAGWIASTMYHFARESEQYAAKEGINPFTEWWKAWNVFKWSHDGQIDFLAPTFVNGAIALLAWWVLR